MKYVLSDKMQYQGVPVRSPEYKRNRCTEVLTYHTHTHIHTQNLSLVADSSSLKYMHGDVILEYGGSFALD